MNSSNEHIENISAFAKKLQVLRGEAEKCQEKWPNFPWSGGADPAGDPYWQKAVQPLVNETDLDLIEVEDCIAGHSSPQDGFGGYVVPTGTFEQNLIRDIRFVMNSRRPDCIDALLQQVKRVQCRREKEDRQAEHPGARALDKKYTSKQKTADEKKAAIAVYLKNHPDATSPEIGNAIGILDADVRKLEWLGLTSLK